MIVLGIHCGHDFSAAVISDGENLADAAEERFARLKHCNHMRINRSLARKGIMITPQEKLYREAIRYFLETGLDALFLGNFLLEK